MKQSSSVNEGYSEEVDEEMGEQAHATGQQEADNDQQPPHINNFGHPPEPLILLGGGAGEGMGAPDGKELEAPDAKAPDALAVYNDDLQESTDAGATAPVATSPVATQVPAGGPAVEISATQKSS